jgi:hypothetical protein
MNYSTMSDGWSTQLASDLDRDGMGLELLAPDGKVVAEIFRSDSEHFLTVETFETAIPASIFNQFYRDALARLDPFEDGTTFKAVGLPVA